jgi:AraC-like DNA-binding protein
MALDPTFVAAVADASACIGRIEFTNRCAFQDTAITHLMSALRAELQAGCPAGRLYGESLAMALTMHLLRQRIAHARHLLVENHLSLAEVSYRLGFPSQAHFTTMFRKLVGTTPGAYRQGQ